MDRTVSSQEHFVLINYYQNKIQKLEAKLEVEQSKNLMTL